MTAGRGRWRSARARAPRPLARWHPSRRAAVANTPSQTERRAQGGRCRRADRRRTALPGPSGARALRRSARQARPAARATRIAHNRTPRTRPASAGHQRKPSASGRTTGRPSAISTARMASGGRLRASGGALAALISRAAGAGSLFATRAICSSDVFSRWHSRMISSATPLGEGRQPVASIPSSPPLPSSSGEFDSAALFIISTPSVAAALRSPACPPRPALRVPCA